MNKNIWLTSIQDLLTRHIYNGLRKTYTDVHRITQGKKIAIAVQTAMEGIVTLSRVVLNEDYRIFLKELQRLSKTEENFNDLIKNAYYSYAVDALKSAGLHCDNLDVSILGTNLVLGMEFVHSVYINTARTIWINPFMLINNDVNQLYEKIHSSIEKSVRDSIDLNSIMGNYNQKSSSLPVRTKPQTILEHFNEINHNKNILDSDSEEDDEEEEQILKQVGGSKSSSSLEDIISKIPDQPNLDDELTVDDETDAPDNETFLEEESSSSDDEPMIINIPKNHSQGAMLKSTEKNDDEKTIHGDTKEENNETIDEENIDEEDNDEENIDEENIDEENIDEEDIDEENIDDEDNDEENQEINNDEDTKDEEETTFSFDTSNSTKVEVNVELLSDNDDTESVVKPRLNSNDSSNNESIRALVDHTLQNMNSDEQDEQIPVEETTVEEETVDDLESLIRNITMKNNNIEENNIEEILLEEGSYDDDVLLEEGSCNGDDDDMVSLASLAESLASRISILEHE